LSYLGNLLQEKHLDLVTYHKKAFEMEEQKKANEVLYVDNRIADRKAEAATKQQHIKNLKNRQMDLQEEMGRISKNTDVLIAQRNGFLSNQESEKNVLSVLLHSNTIQQNIAYLNTLRDRADQIESNINDLELQIAQLQTALNDLERQKRYVSEEINNLEFRKNNIQNIQILQPPTSSADPIKPKKTLNVVLGAVVGLFAMLFLAFFLEYIQRHRAEHGS